MSARGEVRIIGGRWRSRRLRFPAAPGLRPTPDRLRETLFNWLGPWIVGRRVLDLFAGSGALGFEALSRGAAEAVFVERGRRAARALDASARVLGADAGAHIVHIDALAWLRAAPAAAPFDLVFLDPPFADPIAESALALLAGRGLLAPAHRVYLERPRTAEAPAGWELLRSAVAGGVRGMLLQRGVPEDAADAPREGIAHTFD